MPPKLSPRTFDSSGIIPLDQACSSESIRLLDRLWENSDPIAIQSTGWSFCHHLRADIHYYRHQFSKSLRAVVKRGDLDIVKWILNHFSGCQAEVEVVQDAARYGRLEILQFFLEYERQEIQEKNVIIWGGCDVEKAIEAEHGEIARWLVDNVPHAERSFAHAMGFAVHQGDMAMIQWLLDEVQLPPPSMNNAAAGNQMELVKWIFEQGFNGESGLALEGAAKLGRLDIVEWLIENGITQGLEEAVDAASDEGHLAIVQWILDRRFFIYPRFAMHCAIEHGHLDIAKYLKKAGFVYGLPDMVKDAASEGHIHVVKWLYEEYSSQTDFLFPPCIRIDGLAQLGSETAMDKAAGKGRLHMLTYLQSLALDIQAAGKEYYPTCSEEAFSAAASGGAS